MAKVMPVLFGITNGPMAHSSSLRAFLYSAAQLHHRKSCRLQSMNGSHHRCGLTCNRFALPAIYGPGNNHHRTFEYLKRMDDRRPATLLNKVRASWR